MRRSLALLLTTMLALTTACDEDTGDEGGNDTSADDGGEDRAATILGLTGDAANFESDFAANCGIAGCHGPSGNDGNAPALMDRVGALTDEEIVDILLEGVTDGDSGMVMTSQSHLSDQQLANALAYVNANFR
jgi:mono/diheme cytochrome c family protein